MIKVEYSNGLINYYNNTIDENEQRKQEAKRYKEVNFVEIGNDKKKVILYFIPDENIKFSVYDSICKELIIDKKEIKENIYGKLTYNNHEIQIINAYFNGEYCGKYAYIVVNN